MESRKITEEELYEILCNLIEQTEEISQKLYILRNKIQAACTMIGDLDDNPAGSLRERVSAIEKLLLDGVSFKDKIKLSFTHPHHNQLFLKFHS